eukprot:TRINITY_DN12_c0_g1_i4.p1 TRINITY_DN12_c0_g1~~TRINITY_DN12_c0_g1_i4.p1  ORF type:complete len:483 (-),score=14.30 TRINITY_DN12_c0_g1_i4:152-1600(-)
MIKVLFDFAIIGCLIADHNLAHAKRSRSISAIRSSGPMLPDSTAVIVGLKRSVDLNGKHVRVLRLESTEDRYLVELWSNGEKKLIRQSNLVLLQSYCRTLLDAREEIGRINAYNASEYHEILCVARGADANDVRRQFKRRSLLVHPDKNANDEEATNAFLLLKTAYDALNDGPKPRDQPSEEPNESPEWPPGPSNVDKESCDIMGLRACINSDFRCAWDQRQMRCVPFQCGYLRSVAMCSQPGTCDWSLHTKTCLDRPCERINESTCPSDRCELSWTGRCHYRCSSHAEEEICPPGTCRWSSSKDECVRRDMQLPCTDYKGHLDCIVARKYGCAWFAAENACSLPCDSFDEQSCSDSTSAPLCAWSRTSQKCVHKEDITCQDFTNKTECLSGTEKMMCGWSRSEARCVPADDIPCKEFRWQDCPEHRCRWATTIRRCLTKPTPGLSSYSKARSHVCGLRTSLVLATLGPFVALMWSFAHETT